MLILCDAECAKSAPFWRCAFAEVGRMARFDWRCRDWFKQYPRDDASSYLSLAVYQSAAMAMPQNRKRGAWGREGLHIVVLLGGRAEASFGDQHVLFGAGRAVGAPLRVRVNSASEPKQVRRS